MYVLILLLTHSGFPRILSHQLHIRIVWVFFLILMPLLILLCLNALPSIPSSIRSSSGGSGHPFSGQFLRPINVEMSHFPLWCKMPTWSNKWCPQAGTCFPRNNSQRCVSVELNLRTNFLARYKSKELKIVPQRSFGEILLNYRCQSAVFL